MSPGGLDAFTRALAAIPLGTSWGRVRSRRYVTTRSAFNGAKSTKLVAEELGGSDYVSLNFFDLRAGPVLKTCEMPAAKVIDFELRYAPEATEAAAVGANP